MFLECLAYRDELLVQHFGDDLAPRLVDHAPVQLVLVFHHHDEQVTGRLCRLLRGLLGHGGHGPEEAGDEDERAWHDEQNDHAARLGEMATYVGGYPHEPGGPVASPAAPHGW